MEILIINKAQYYLYPVTTEKENQAHCQSTAGSRQKSLVSARQPWRLGTLSLPINNSSVLISRAIYSRTQMSTFRSLHLSILQKTANSTLLKNKSALLGAAEFYHHVLIPHLESQVSKVRLSVAEEKGEECQYINCWPFRLNSEVQSLKTASTCMQMQNKKGIIFLVLIASNHFKSNTAHTSCPASRILSPCLFQNTPLQHQIANNSEFTPLLHTVIYSFTGVNIAQNQWLPLSPLTVIAVLDATKQALACLSHT